MSRSGLARGRDPELLRIVITADPYLPVPPVHYGGIERVIDSLVRGLVARGHTVTLVAHPASQTPATLVPYGSGTHWSRSERATELAARSLNVSCVFDEKTCAATRSAASRSGPTRRRTGPSCWR